MSRRDQDLVANIRSLIPEDVEPTTLAERLIRDSIDAALGTAFDTPNNLEGIGGGAAFPFTVLEREIRTTELRDSTGALIADLITDTQLLQVEDGAGNVGLFDLNIDGAIETPEPP